MTRKDYVLIARTFNMCRPMEREVEAMRQWRTDVGSIAGALQDDNARFDRERFIAACEEK